MTILDQTFFLSFHEQTIFFPKVAEQTIYFPKFAEQSFFHKKNIAPPPHQESNGRPLKPRYGAWSLELENINFFFIAKNLTWR